MRLDSINTQLGIKTIHNTDETLAKRTFIACMKRATLHPFGTIARLRAEKRCKDIYSATLKAANTGANLDTVVEAVTALEEQGDTVKSAIPTKVDETVNSTMAQQLGEQGLDVTIANSRVDQIVEEEDAPTVAGEVKKEVVKTKGFIEKNKTILLVGGAVAVAVYFMTKK